MFSYLGKTVTLNNNDWEALYINLKKTKRIWGVVAKVLVKMGEPIKAREMVNKVVVQAPILYVSEIWVMMDVMMTVLE